MNSSPVTCLFCRIMASEVSAAVVFEDEVSLAFLDHRPLFPGHCLLVPRKHVERLTDLPGALIAPFFATTKLLTETEKTSLEAAGTFGAMNNRVSQSVPH